MPPSPGSPGIFKINFFVYSSRGAGFIVELLVTAEGLLFAEGLPQDSAACDWARCPMEYSGAVHILRQEVKCSSEVGGAGLFPW